MPPCTREAAGGFAGRTPLGGPAGETPLRADRTWGMLSRSTIIGALVVVELAIIGMAAGAIAGVPSPAGFAFPPLAFRHGANLSSTTLNRTLVTGPSPHVVIDVHDLDLAIETAEAPAVKVIETKSSIGFVTDDSAPVVQQTADGVRVHGENASDMGVFGRTLHLTVPPGARLEIISAGDIDADGLRAKLIARSVNGVISISNHRGDLDLSATAGRIVLTNVEGSDIAANTREGRLLFRRVSADRLDASSDGHYIEAVDLRVVDGALTTRSGHVDVSFTGDSDATVNAHTDDGRVHVRGLPTSDDSRSASVVHLGSGRGHFDVSTGDGSITITRGATNHA